MVFLSELTDANEVLKSHFALKAFLTSRSSNEMCCASLIALSNAVCDVLLGIYDQIVISKVIKIILISDAVLRFFRFLICTEYSLIALSMVKLWLQRMKMKMAISQYIC